VCLIHVRTLPVRLDDGSLLQQPASCSRTAVIQAKAISSKYCSLMVIATQHFQRKAFCAFVTPLCKLFCAANYYQAFNALDLAFSRHAATTLGDEPANTSVLQMRCVEQAITSIAGPSASVLIFRQPQGHKRQVSLVMRECCK